MSHSEKKQYYVELLKQYKDAHGGTSKEENKEQNQAEGVSSLKETADCASSPKQAAVSASACGVPPSAATAMDARRSEKGEPDRTNSTTRLLQQQQQQQQQQPVQATLVALVHPQPLMGDSEAEQMACSPDDIVAINELRTLLETMQVATHYDPYTDEASYQAAGRGSAIPRTSVYGWIVSSDDQGGVFYQSPRGRGRPLY
ncbi:hypothetical protein V5799_020184 [Amblyomma americanum]|uniref:Uncharacterized protein n=1 Tax=Amblyomma americanum TaxID=6943 RepID=A0AAQ4EUK5_AMBAM